MEQASLLHPINGNQVKWGLVVECASLKEEYRCNLDAVGMFSVKVRPLDSLYVLLEAGEKRKQFAERRPGPSSAFFPKRAEAPGVGTLKLNAPANPAMLVRDMQVIRSGPIAEVPLGATLVIGDAPGLPRHQHGEHALHPLSATPPTPTCSPRWCR